MSAATASKVADFWLTSSHFTITTTTAAINILFSLLGQANNEY